MTHVPDIDLPQAVLFDMDGTLVDTEPLWMQAEQFVMERLGATWTHADQLACLGTPLHTVIVYMSERGRIEHTLLDVETWLMDEMERLILESDLAWQPGAPEILVDCVERGIPAALVTASWQRLVRAVQRHMAADLHIDPFTVIVAGDEVENGKPHPEPYLTAAAALGADIAHCLAIEDSPTGVSSAVASGARVVAVPQLTGIDQPGVHVIDSLAGRSVADLWAATG